MDQPDIKQPERRHGKGQMCELLALYENSHGMTIKAFCQLHKINTVSFYAARKRSRAVVVEKRSPGFIPVSRPVSDQQGLSLFAEVKGIKLYQPVPADYLKALII